MAEISFFGSSSRSSAQRLAIIEKYRNGSVSESYMHYGLDYFDNPEHSLGYHGYKYDGRYASVVAKMIEHYKLTPGMTVLEVGCAKGFVLVEFFKLGMKVTGIDYSEYALTNSHPDIKEFLYRGSAYKMSFQDREFDFVIAKEVLPHIPTDQIRGSLRECKRVSKGKIFFEIQSGRTPREIEYMKLWDRTHLTSYPPEWWNSIMREENIDCDVHYNILVPEI